MTHITYFLLVYTFILFHGTLKINNITAPFFLLFLKPSTQWAPEALALVSSGLSVKLTNHLLLKPRLGLSGSIPPLLIILYYKYIKNFALLLKNRLCLL